MKWYSSFYLLDAKFNSDVDACVNLLFTRPLLAVTVLLNSAPIGSSGTRASSATCCFFFFYSSNCLASSASSLLTLCWTSSYMPEISASSSFSALPSSIRALSEPVSLVSFYWCTALHSLKNFVLRIFLKPSLNVSTSICSLSLRICSFCPSSISSSCYFSTNVFSNN